MKQWYTNSYAKVVMLVMAFVIVGIIPMLRPDASFLGAEPYFLLRISEHLSWHDSLGYGGRVLPYSLGVPAIASAFPAYWALPVVSVMLSLLFFYLILRDKNVAFKELAVLIAAASPPMLFMASSLSTVSFALLFTLVGFYLLEKRSMKIRPVSIVVLGLVPAFDVVVGLIVLALLIAYVVAKKDSRTVGGIAIAAMAVSVALISGLALAAAGIPELPTFDILPPGLNGRVMQVIAEFGSVFGLSLFGIIVGVMGISKDWKKKYKDIFLFIAVMLLVVLSFLRSEAVVLLNVFIAVFAAAGLAGIIEKKWESSMLKTLTVLVLVCGLVFSCVMVSDRISKGLPDDNMAEGFKALALLEDGVVFSHHSRGHWIAHAGKGNVMDDRFIFSPDVNERFRDSETLLHTRDIAVAKEIISKYDVKYIWIDAEMRDMLWEGEEDGLLFILKYNPNILKAYDKGGVEIWGVDEGLFEE